ncbi:MAG: superoxide dismutase family protein [Lachnospiraceae bacterium]|nr:superoxide dismutase family protein [Lachnospiraceae bacterium]
MYQFTPRTTFNQILENNKPAATAWVTGNSANPQLSGLVKFFDTPYGGILVEAEIFGLPDVSEVGSSNFYAMHIHENGDCSQNFIHTGNHYNPTDQLHPQHVGDMPPLLANQGYAWLSFYDKRFQLKDVIGRSVIIHAHPDDFMTQPSGNSGDKIGCGVIRKGE